MNVRGILLQGRSSYARLFVLLVLAGGITLPMGGCLVTAKGPKAQPTLGFVPMKVYAYNYETTWNKVLAGLREQGIMVSMLDKQNGVITTEYVQGRTIDVAAIKKETYRHKYQISLEKQGASKTAVHITCRLESVKMYKGGSAREAVEQLKPWQDVTHEKRDMAGRLENWLYEQLERHLLGTGNASSTGDQRGEAVEIKQSGSKHAAVAERKNRETPMGPPGGGRNFGAGRSGPSSKMASTAVAPRGRSASGELTLKGIIESLNPEVYSRQEIKEFWGGVRGRTIAGEGKVHSGRGDVVD